MNVNVLNISKYVERVIGCKVSIAPIEKGIVRSLPIFITDAYQLLQCEIFGNDVCLMVCKENTATPMQLKKHSSIVEAKMNMPAAVVLAEVKPYNMKRMIEARVNIIVPGRQLFLPSLLMDMRPQRNPVDMKDKPMPPMAQCVILYHLQKYSLNNMSAEPIAERMHVSYPNINRAIKWLADNHFVTLTPTREKQITFIHDGHELWQQALPMLQNPIERIVRTDEVLDAPICGEEALAELTMLAEPQEYYRAISKQQAKQLKKNLHNEFGDNRVEVWRYDPMLLAEDGRVDALSLYLSLRDTEDERVHKEINQLIKDRQW